MNNTHLAFILTIISGLSTMLGTFLIFLNFKNNNKIIAISLSFASSVMISISIIDLIPEAIKLTSNQINSYISLILVFIAIIIGILISILINTNINSKISQKKSLYKIGILSMITIILHNIPEGIATFIATNSNTKLGIKMAFAIALHNIPEGISISIPLYHSTKNRKKALLYTLISALSEPFGAILAYIFLIKIINNLSLGIIFAIIAGIMINISITELLPAAKKYNYNKITIISFIIGIIFSLLQFI